MHYKLLSFPKKVLISVVVVVVEEKEYSRWF